MREREYKDFSPSAKKGISKYSALSSSGMKEYANKYKERTGKNPYSINNKEDFYRFVSRAKIR